MDVKPERFGHARLATSEHVPVRLDERSLSSQSLTFLWIAALSGPAIYSGATRGLPLSQGVLAVTLGMLAAVLVALALHRGARRYGLSSLGLMRAAMGPRGAYLGIIIRVLSAALLGAAWLLELGRWTHNLLLAVVSEPVFKIKLVGGGPSIVVIVVVLVCLALGMATAWRGTVAAARVAAVSLLLMGIAGAGLLVFAGIRSRGFGTLLHGKPNTNLNDFLQVVVTTALFSLPGALSAGDWLRLAKVGGTGRERLRQRLAPWGVLLFAGVIAWFGLLMASASHVLRQQFDAHPIADAAGFGGLGAGALGLAWALALWLLAGPLWVLLGPALALVGLARPGLNLSRSLVVAALAVLGGVLLLAYMPMVAWKLLAAGSLLGLLGVLLVDEWLWRRGGVLLEEVFLFGSHYGVFWGISLAGVLGVLAGGGVFVTATLPGAWPEGLPVLGGTVAVVGAALGASVGVYLGLRVVEAGLAFALNGVRGRAKNRTPAMLNDQTKTEGLTNPHFVYSRPPGADALVDAPLPKDK